MARLNWTKSERAKPKAHKDTSLQAGARNLLVGCAELQPGQRVLILHEDPALGWFDIDAPLAVAEIAESLGAPVDLLQVGGPDTPLPPEFLAMRWRVDIEIWFARIGDQDRFQTRDLNRTKVVSYTRTASALASSFGTTPHLEMLALKDHVDAIVSKAMSIHISCPMGTNLRGTPITDGTADVTVRRFPMCVPCPVPTNTFSGTVALSGYLTPTGSQSYAPASLRLTDLVIAHVDMGRITGFEGCPETVGQIQAHYNHVASMFDIDPMAVHSWHAGIHDGCSFDMPADVNPDLWSNTIFGSPQWLHFHTCGNYAPGEICWMISNPTVTFDERTLWLNGVLKA